MDTRSRFSSILRSAGVELAFVLIWAGALSGQRDRPAPPPRPETGIVNLQFQERHPLSAMAVLRERFGWTKEFIQEHDPVGDYDLSKQNFAAYVPEKYQDKVPHGLLVWINPIDDPWFHPEWAPVLDGAQFIAVEALKAGNDQFVWLRIGLALDAVHNMRKLYNIDSARVFVGGFSGGGRCAASVGLHFPDVFQGFYAMGGMNWFSSIRNPDPIGVPWQPQIPRPPSSRLRVAAKERRHVIMVGAQDFNHAHATLVHRDALKNEGFTALLLQEMKDSAHVPADGKTFSEGLKFLVNKGTPKGTKPR